ncbi:SDR family NAD(P)-dependent oxidoreductase [Nocardia sp. NPDC127526]|uniref:SDR family NAD(P)-dependent oxidoreductase n=1 Tax=Nocardia sp. NPDC127526 TaxID=3345393 RepID=UPI00363AC4AF
MSEFPHPTRTVLVTGATSGIGFALARRLVDDGATVLVHARSQAEGDLALEELVKDGAEPLRLRLVVADFARLSEVRELADTVIKTTERLDTLVNNAAMAGPQGRTLTEDGHEITLQVGYLAPVLLSTLLAPLLAEVGGRIVNVSSDMHKAGSIGWNDLARNKFYLPLPVYTQAKLALTMFGRTFAEQRNGEISVVSVNPGTVRTPLLRIYDTRGTAPAEAAEILAEYCPPERPVISGGYYDRREPAKPAALVDNATARTRLAKLTGQLLG